MDHVQSVKIRMSTCLVLVGPSGKRALVSTREGTSNDHTTAATIRESGIFEQTTHDTDGRPAHACFGLFLNACLQTEAFLGCESKEEEGNTLLDTQFDASGKWRGSDDTVLPHPARRYLFPKPFGAGRHRQSILVESGCCQP